jgi:hydrogenase nickel incorporation protein HypA/HybF
MHELSLALSIAEIAANEASHYEGQPIAVHLKLGALAGVTPEALLSAWELARRDTALENAELVIEAIPVVAYCPLCRAERGVVSLQQCACSQCGAPVKEILHGRELELAALELVE